MGGACAGGGLVCSVNMHKQETIVAISANAFHTKNGTQRNGRCTQYKPDGTIRKRQRYFDCYCMYMNEKQGDLITIASMDTTEPVVCGSHTLEYN